MILSNCPITKQNSEVIKSCVMSDKDPLYKVYKGYHTGVDLTASEVYSLYSGTIVSVGFQDEGHSVIVQTGSSLCICYRWLTHLADVRSGMEITQGYHLGTVHKYVHVESYLTEPSIWPVRIGATTWYKSDITPILEKGFDFAANQTTPRYFSSMGIIEASDFPGGVSSHVEGAAKIELTDNRGDD